MKTQLENEPGACLPDYSVLPDYIANRCKMLGDPLSAEQAEAVRAAMKSIQQCAIADGMLSVIRQFSQHHNNTSTT